ncbi:hypothetical protein [Micromonospora pisi]|uniref:hypothetical protein n=1 Tax=Micromonospora pisi TaxID=589240 RepID=UPI0011C3C7D4|nr:hypothetical protein [Micromonospora pisi]
MDRDVLIALLAAAPEPPQACIAALQSGSSFKVFDPSAPARQFADIWRVREQIVQDAGIPTDGWHPGLESLTAAGEQPVRVGVVQVPDTRKRFKLFLSADASALVACIG